MPGTGVARQLRQRQLAGPIAPAQGNVHEALSSCLLEWEYPGTAGEDGWEFVGTVGRVGGDRNARVPYLRREQG